jgi:hypothetical protein
MEDVLDLYAEPYRPSRPVVCFDERPVQLLGEVRQPLPPQPGQPQRIDYEYHRNGTCNLFTYFQPLAGWEESRNQARATVAWRFTTTDARAKLQRLYPSK